MTRGIKLEGFRFTEISSQKWRASWTDIETGKRHRVRIGAKSLDEVLVQARKVRQCPPEPRTKWRPEKRRQPRGEVIVHISEVFIKAAANRNRSAKTQKDWDNQVEAFLKWVDKEGLSYWGELNLEVIEMYLASQKGKAFDSIRLSLWPIRMASKWAAANWPHSFTDICAGITLRREQQEKRKVAMSVKQVVSLLDKLRQEESLELAAGVALQGLCGMRLEEAFRLRWQDVDLSQGTVLVGATDKKNRYSHRLIPICCEALGLLRAARPVGAKKSEPLLRSWSHSNTYSKSVKRQIKKPEGIAPKDLRKTIPTAAIQGGWYDPVIMERYIGHAAKSVTERHYLADGLDELLVAYRDKVLAPLEAEIAKAREELGRQPKVV